MAPNPPRSPQWACWASSQRSASIDGHAAGAGGGDGLTVDVVLHIAAGEDTVDVGCRRAVLGEQVPLLVDVEDIGEQVGVGTVSDGDEQAGDRQGRLLGGLDVAHADSFDLLVAVDVGDDGVPQELDLRVGERSILHDLAGPQGVPAMDQGDLVGEAGEERRLLDGRVTAAHHGDVLATEEEPVTCGARRHAVPNQPLLGFEPEQQRLRAGAHDQRLRFVDVVMDVHLERSR